MFTKSFQARIEDANKVFILALEKLKSVQSDINETIAHNNDQMKKLEEENANLNTLNQLTDRQIGEIGKLIV